MANRAADRKLMLKAIELARHCESEPGRVSPKVGALVVKDGVVIGEAYRGELSPGEHAEYTLLERKLGSQSLAGSTLFTTLEPCTARSDPKVPCVERIIERRIARVVIGVLDPNRVVHGGGELRLRDVGIAVGRFDSDLMPIIEELNRDFARQHRGPHIVERNVAQIKDPVADGEVGPNGHRIGYSELGDKVEWVPADDDSGDMIPMILRRNDRAILDAYNEAWDKVWWNRHQNWAHRLAVGEETLRPGQEEVFRQARLAAKRIEAKYGAENLGWSDFEWGALSGRLSTLAWVLGTEWEESFDT
jgi:pyrimidine deaminase RibD-like protein